MKYIPHEYQTYATRFILDHPEAAIFLDCGLGKTVITLTAIRDLMLDRFEISRVLVIAPIRVAQTSWPEEIRKWDHLRDLTCAVAVGTPSRRLAALRSNAMITVINRENVTWLEECGEPFDFDMIVVDELSSFKNGQAKRFRSLLKLRPFVKRIVGLTGTPSPNGLMDLWAEFRLLDHGQRLGRFITYYRERWFLPDRRNGMRVFSWKPRPGADKEIYERVGDMTISMKNTEHLHMPECVLNTVSVEMSEEEQQMYETLKQEYVLDLYGQEIDALNAASLSAKLIQLASGAIYTENETPPKGCRGRSESPLRNSLIFHDRKLDALEDLIESANGCPVLVAYWYRHDLDRIRARFPEAREIRTPEDIRAWNAGELPVALIHPASAGHGLNLQSGGHILIWFTLPWSLELYQQTNARLWRQGQQSSTVIIHHILTKDTIDEDIRAALARKETTQSALIHAVRARIGRIGGKHEKTVQNP